MSEGYTVEQSGPWYKLIGPDGEQEGKSQRSEEDAWALLDPPAAEPDPPETDASGLPTSRWHGLKNYHCPECSFAHLDSGEVYEHVRRRHTA